MEEAREDRKKEKMSERRKEARPIARENDLSTLS